MSTDTRRPQNSGATDDGTDPRSRYIPVGTDNKGAHHLYRTADETVLVVARGEVVERFDISDRHIDDYVRFVRDEVQGRNWTERRYLLPGEWIERTAKELAEAMQ